MSVVDKILASLDTHSQGFSARKLSALAIMLIVIWAHVVWLIHSAKHDDFVLLPEILIIDFSFITACLGMTTWEKKNKQTAPTNDEKLP